MSRICFDIYFVLRFPYSTWRFNQLCISSLKRDGTIKILPADKGNATVIMNTIDYNDKIASLLSSNTYKRIDKDPTKSIEDKIYRTLYKYKNQFTDLERRQLTPHYSKTPHFYGLPKIHRNEVPLRPIISSIGSLCQNLSRYLLKILSPLSYNTNTYIKNTHHFLEKLHNTTLYDSDVLLSFDVVSLFTNIPVNKTLTIIRTKLENDNTLSTRTNLHVDTIMELLELCIRTTYFQFNNEYFKQEFGMPMGSPLSPLISNIFMEHFEETHITNYQNGPRVWLRYVDDVFVIWPYDDAALNNFMNYINRQENTIKFTIEMEKIRTLPFLDVSVVRSEKHFETNIYRKPTHTNRYLNFNSNHNISIKQGIVKCLYDRAKLLISEQSFLKEKILIKQILELNEYPTNFIDKTMYKIENPRRYLPSQNDEGNTLINVIPDVPGISERLRSVGNKFNIKTVFKTQNTLRSILTQTKPFNIEYNSKNSIYNINCSCGKRYIDETSRPVKVRQKEHMKLIRDRRLYGSKLSDHVLCEDGDHTIDWNNVKILQKEPMLARRKLKESACIVLSGEECISQCSFEMHHMWIPLIKRQVEYGNFNIK